MTDVSGIPNMGFGGGGYFGGNAATGQPAMSSAQIMASLYGNYSPGQAQSTLNNIYGPQGFGGQTAQYAAQGAAYGRLTGGFPNTPAGYAAARAANMGPGQNVPTSYGSTHNEGAPVPQQPAPYSKGQFNPQTYGWDHNEGAAVPTFGMGLPNAGTQNFQDLWNNRGRVYQPPVIESPYGPGGYPPMTPRGGEQQGNLNWYGMPNATS